MGDDGVWFVYYRGRRFLIPVGIGKRVNGDKELLDMWVPERISGRVLDKISRGFVREYHGLDDALDSYVDERGLDGNNVREVVEGLQDGFPEYADSLEKYWEGFVGV